MSETRVEIPDEPPGDEPALDQPPAGAYKNLWVPLVVVPAGIVIAIVSVFALFGALGGEEASLARNLETVVSGGKNERDQALFNLTRQALENNRARSAGEPLPWEMEPDFLADVRDAVEEIDEEELDTRLTLGVLLATLGDDSGVTVLISTLATAGPDDEDGMARFQALQNLGLIGDPRAIAAVLPFLEHDDEGLRTVAASALANLGAALAGDDPRASSLREGLVQALSDGSLTVRGTAAISLSLLQPPEPAAGDVLLDLLDLETYAAEREARPDRFRDPRLVSQNRVQAVQALARLERPQDRARMEALRSDADIAVSEAAMVGLDAFDGE